MHALWQQIALCLSLFGLTNAAFRQPPACLDPASCKAHSRKQWLKHFPPHNPHFHSAATFRAVSAEKGPRLNQAGGRRFRGREMRGEMSGEAHNSGRKPPPAPSQRRTAAADLPRLRTLVWTAHAAETSHAHPHAYLQCSHNTIPCFAPPFAPPASCSPPSSAAVEGARPAG